MTKEEFEICRWCHRPVGPNDIHIPKPERGRCLVRVKNPSTGQYDAEGVTYERSNELGELGIKVKHEISRLAFEHMDDRGGNINNAMINILNITMQFCVQLQQDSLKSIEFASLNSHRKMEGKDEISTADFKSGTDPENQK
jgi:hypothetical protein